MKRLVVDGFGKFISRSGDQILVKEKNRVLHRVLAEKLRQVVVVGRGAISFDAMELLGENGVDLIVIDWRGRVTVRLSSSMPRTVKTRREQYYAYMDERSGYLAKQFVNAKIKNQYYFLGTLSKSRVHREPEKAEEITGEREKILVYLDKMKGIKDEPVDRVRERIMGIEGRASYHYWEAVSKVVPENFGFKGRTGRHAEDPVNSMLNYGYAILEGEVWMGIHYAGLDPYGGFLHVDRPGRPSMVLDLMEEFRQQTVDRTVLTLVNRGEVKIDDFSFVEGTCKLGGRVREKLLKRLLGKFEEYVRHRDVRVKWTNLILKQARGIAAFLRGDTVNYEPFYLRW